MSLSIKILVGFIAAFATLAAITISFQYRAMRAAMYEAEESSASNILGTIQSIVREVRTSSTRKRCRALSNALQASYPKSRAS
jgi:dihydroxyacetone kinase-like predicted kinase